MRRKSNDESAWKVFLSAVGGLRDQEGSTKNISNWKGDQPSLTARPRCWTIAAKLSRQRRGCGSDALAEPVPEWVLVRYRLSKKAEGDTALPRCPPLPAFRQAQGPPPPGPLTMRILLYGISLSSPSFPGGPSACGALSLSKGRRVSKRARDHPGWNPQSRTVTRSPRLGGIVSTPDVLYTSGTSSRDRVACGAVVRIPENVTLARGEDVQVGNGAGKGPAS